MRNCWKNIVAFCFVSFFCLTSGYAEQFPPSVEVHDDGTVTFRYCGEAKTVKLQADFLYVGEQNSDYTDHSKRFNMVKDSTGCFSVTTRPISPETYTYCFRIDGHRRPDPYNPDSAWQKLHVWSVFTVGGTPKTDLYLQPKRKGHVDQKLWYSSGEKKERRVDIYVPADYDPAGQPMDALYLLHGINGYEGSWIERGRAIQILENMVAQGRCKPMLIVMPDINFGAHADKPSLHTMWSSVIHYPRQRRARYVEDSLIDLVRDIDSTYNVTGRNAFAGLSDGARVAMNMAQWLPTEVYAVGLFTPIVPKSQTPKDSTAMHCQLNGCTYYSLTVGKTDLFYKRGLKIHQRLLEADIHHSYTEIDCGHYWRTWRECLINFLDEIADLQQ